jgi:putative tryptophan/tyrosine transport system substrate-binding protein
MSANIRRREFITLLGGAAAWPLAAHAQQLARRIGMLETIPPQANASNFDALRKGLRELGYDEGRGLIIEYRSADGRAEGFPALAAELVRLNVDVIVTRGTPSALAARNATRTIPIVMASVGDVIGTGLAVSLARPGGNVTGLTAINTDTEGKRLELLKEMVPGLVRIAALYNMGNPTFALRWKEVELAARALGAESQLLDVRKPEDIAPAFAAATAQRAGALLTSVDALIQANQRTILELAAKHRLPAIYSTRDFVGNGGLMAYGVSYPDLYRRAATYIEKIFKGAKPAAADQIRFRHQSNDRQGARPYRAADAASNRRRSDRVKALCCTA